MCKAPPSTNVIVDGDRQLRSRSDESCLFTVDQLFAVMLLWHEQATAGWEGWLTTTDHRALRFSMDELAEAPFQRWLASLPGWHPDRMVDALGRPGLHLVWRRSGD